MSKPQMNYKLAHAIGWDAGNRHMRANGRTTWDEDDYNRACEAFNQLMSPAVPAFLVKEDEPE